MFAESIWMDHRRFYARYGGEPEEKTLLGRAAACGETAVFGIVKILCQISPWAASRE